MKILIPSVILLVLFLTKLFFSSSWAHSHTTGNYITQPPLLQMPFYKVPCQGMWGEVICATLSSLTHLIGLTPFFMSYELEHGHARDPASLIIGWRLCPRAEQNNKVKGTWSLDTWMEWNHPTKFVTHLGWCVREIDANFFNPLYLEVSII